MTDALIRHEFSRPVRVPDFQAWTNRATLAAVYVGSVAAGLSLLIVGQGAWATVSGWFLLAGGAAGAVAWWWLVKQYTQLEWWELKEYEAEQVDDGRFVPVNTAQGQRWEPVTRGIFSQREFASISREAEERGKLTRDRHGFSGSRYQDVVSWLRERGYIDTQNSWTNAGLSWLKIPSSSSSPRGDSEFSKRGGG